MFLRETWLKNSFFSKSQVDVCVKLFQLFLVNNSLPILKAGLFLSAIIGFQISFSADQVREGRYGIIGIMRS